MPERIEIIGDFKFDLDSLDTNLYPTLNDYRRAIDARLERLKAAVSCHPLYNLRPTGGARRAISSLGEKKSPAANGRTCVRQAGRGGASSPLNLNLGRKAKPLQGTTGTRDGLTSRPRRVEPIVRRTRRAPGADPGRERHSRTQ